MYKYLLLAVIFFIGHNCAAQKNVLEFQAEAVGNILHSKKGNVRAMNDLGLNYQRYVFAQTYVVFGLQGNIRTYNDDSKDTLNRYFGELQNRQWQGYAGVRYYFKEEIVYTVNYFAQCSFHYTRSNTAGNYTGGIYRNGYNEYNRFKGVGFGLKLGAIYQQNSPWQFGANVTLYLSAGKKGNLNSENKINEKPAVEALTQNESFARSAIELRVGYRFW